MCISPWHEAPITDAPLKHGAVHNHHIDDENLRQADFCHWPITFSRQPPAAGRATRMIAGREAFRLAMLQGNTEPPSARVLLALVSARMSRSGPIALFWRAATHFRFSPISRGAKWLRGMPQTMRTRSRLEQCSSGHDPLRPACSSSATSPDRPSSGTARQAIRQARETRY